MVREREGAVMSIEKQIKMENMREDFPRLPNAPITEALIDIRCELDTDFNVEEFKTLGQTLSNEYPNEKTMHLHQTKIGLDDNKQDISAIDTIRGYRYESSNGVKIVQLRTDGFTYNRLKPYGSWLELRDEAVRVWNLYFDLVKPKLINRIALRYINNLNAPLPMTDLKDYLTCPPEVPEGLPQFIHSFYCRISIPSADERIYGAITQSLDPLVDLKDKIPIILDIDVVKSTQSGFLEEDIVIILEKLRTFKNQIFFNSITTKLLETYK